MDSRPVDLFSNAFYRAVISIVIAAAMFFMSANFEAAVCDASGSLSLVSNQVGESSQSGLNFHIGDILKKLYLHH